MTKTLDENAAQINTGLRASHPPDKKMSQFVELELSAEDTLRLIGVCAREENLCFHSGNDKGRTMAYDLKMELELGLVKAGFGGRLPKSTKNYCTL